MDGTGITTSVFLEILWSEVFSVQSIFNSPAGVSADALVFLIIQYTTKENYLYSG